MSRVSPSGYASSVRSRRCPFSKPFAKHRRMVLAWMVLAQTALDDAILAQMVLAWAVLFPVALSFTVLIRSPSTR